LGEFKGTPDVDGTPEVDGTPDVDVANVGGTGGIHLAGGRFFTFNGPRLCLY
jgi:hypothetical protein